MRQCSSLNKVEDKAKEGNVASIKEKTPSMLLKGVYNDDGYTPITLRAW